MSIRLFIHGPDRDTPPVRDLDDGIYSLGSALDNDIVLDDPSVAPYHAEIVVSKGTITYAEFPNAGTDDQESSSKPPRPLRSGETIKIGPYELRFELDVGATPVPRSADSSQLVKDQHATAEKCKYHPSSLARWHCPKCNLGYCDFCVNVHAGGKSTNVFCRRCGTECDALKIQQTDAFPANNAVATYVQAFTFPLREPGYIMILGIAVAFGVLKIAVDAMGALLIVRPMVALVNFFSYVLTVALFGYILVYGMDVIRSTIGGSDIPPDWPDFGDVPGDLTHLFVAVFVTFAPAFAIQLARASEFWLLSDWSMYAAVLLGFTIFPMAYTAITVFESVTALNPILLLVSIARTPIQYLCCLLVFVLCLVLAYCMFFLTKRFDPGFWPLSVLLSILQGTIQAYLWIAFSRLMGLFVRINEDRLGWFAK